MIARHTPGICNDTKARAKGGDGSQETKQPPSRPDAAREAIAAKPALGIWRAGPCTATRLRSPDWRGIAFLRSEASPRASVGRGDGGAV